MTLSAGLSYASTWEAIMDIVARVTALRGDAPQPVVLSSLPELPPQELGGRTISVVQGPPGRNISLAIGLKAALPNVPLLLVMNADGITLGTNHLIHAARRNIGMTVLLLRSDVTQQADQHLDRMRWEVLGFQGALETTATPLEWAMALQAALVGRGTLEQPDDLAALISQAFDTPGFSLIGVTYASHLEMGVLSRTDYPEFFDSYRRWSASFRNLSDTAPKGVGVTVTPKTDIRRYEVRIVGLGGHGVKVAGTVLSEAAGIGEGLWATQRGEYGSATRGGLSMVDVVFGCERVSYPGADQPDLLVALSQNAIKLYGHTVKPGGYLVADPDQVDILPEGALPVPIVRIAREITDNPITAGVVSLGCVAALSGMVSLETIKEAVVKKVPFKVREKNIAALEAGYQATRQVM
ncbi:MAG: 2-oxoacid:acceptor oxidoreductase family protein [Anaerolineae bacterium]|nr:2-oxoacid:acceptor oxidoreductase family protein [Anaerolineae bacterium]